MGGNFVSSHFYRMPTAVWPLVRYIRPQNHSRHQHGRFLGWVHLVGSVTQYDHAHSLS